MSDPTIRGRFVWHELMTTDMKSAGAFYSKIVGWKTKPWAEDGSYTLFLMDGRQMAGLMAQPDSGVQPSWLTYIGTPDVDETVQHAVSLGGKVHKAPSEIPTIGRFAILEDPQGAIFAVFTPGSSAPANADDAPAGLGDFSWHELATTDWRAALTFYQRLFGWDETNAMDMGPGMGMYQMFGLKGRTLGGLFNKPAQMPGPPSWLPYVRVADAKSEATAIKRLGGRVINGPMEVPGGDWITQGVDLQGGMFAVHAIHMAAAAPAPTPATGSKRAAPAPKRPKAAAKRSKPATKRSVGRTARAKPTTLARRKTVRATKPAARKKTVKTRTRRTVKGARKRSR